MTNKGKLFLIPTVISEKTEHLVIPAHVLNTVPRLKHFLAEDVRTARRFLSALKVFSSIEELEFFELNKNTRQEEVPTLMLPLLKGIDVGLLSESGCPGVADPGALAVKYAHENEITVVPLVGPSSIIMGLMASGLNGQQFCFHGYLPIETRDSQAKIRELERQSRIQNQTQIFIETPYRNNAVFNHLIKVLNPETRLCIAVDITGDSEWIVTRTVRQWKLQTLDLPKKPAVFLFLA